MILRDGVPLQKPAYCRTCHEFVEEKDMVENGSTVGQRVCVSCYYGLRPKRTQMEG